MAVECYLFLHASGRVWCGCAVCGAVHCCDACSVCMKCTYIIYPSCCRWCAVCTYSLPSPSSSFVSDDSCCCCTSSIQRHRNTDDSGTQSSSLAAIHGTHSKRTHMHRMYVVHVVQIIPIPYAYAGFFNLKCFSIFTSLWFCFALLSSLPVT